MTVNLRAKTPSVIINDGTDDLDLSRAVLSYSLESSAIDDSGLHSLSGTIEFESNIAGIAESFDCRFNPSRWKPGNVITMSITIDGTAYPIPTRLKILKYPSRPIPQPGTESMPITLQVGSDLDLYNYRQPEGSAGGVSTFGADTNRTDILTSILGKNNLSLATGETLTAYPLKYAPQKTDGESWVSYAGQVARVCNRQLWQDNAGDIHVDEITPDGLTALNHYTVGTNEGEFELTSFDLLPPEKIRVTGTGLSLSAKSNDADSFSETVDGVTVSTSITYTGQGTSSPTQTETISKPRNVIAPDKTTSTAEEVDIQTSVTESYSGVTGILNSTITLIKEPRAKVLTDSTSFNLIDTKRTEVTYSYDSDQVITQRLSEVRVNNSAGNLVDYQTIRETWRKRGDRYNYSRNVTTAAGFDTKAPTVSQSGNVEPPATQYRPSAFDKEEIEYSHETTFQNDVSSGFGEKEQIVSLPGGLTVSDVQCQGYAELEGRLRHGRQFGINFVAPIAANWLQNYSSVRRIDFTLGGTRTSYLVEGFNIQGDLTSCFVGGMGIEIGTVNADGTGTPAAPYTYT